MPFITIEDLKTIVARHIPSDFEVDAEGPTIVVMTDDEKVLDNEEIVKSLVSELKRRIKLKRKSGHILKKEDAEKKIKEILPPEAGYIQSQFFEKVDEVIVHVKNPKEAIGENRVYLRKILLQTGWYPSIKRYSPIQADIQKKIESALEHRWEEHVNALKVIGTKIFRKTLIDNNDVRVTILGAGREVGRSALLLRAGESSILIDCGISLSGTGIFPFFNVEEFSIDLLDAVIVTHAHLDHSGAVPFLFKYGYEGPVYTTLPTRDLMVLLQKDYVAVAEKENKAMPYASHEIEAELIRTIPLKYEEVTDIAPGISISFFDAGHILGSAMVYIDVDRRNGSETQILYTGDFKLRPSRLLSGAKVPPLPVSTIIMESTYGGHDDKLPPYDEAINKLISIINETIAIGGKVLIPVLAVGRAQEIMLIINEAIENKKIPEVPVYISGMIAEASRLHASYPEYLSPQLRKCLTVDEVDPLLTKNFVIRENVDEAIEYSGPAIILATSGMLSGGPSVAYFRALAQNEKNTVIFVSYQVEGSLGRRILEGVREIEYMDEKGVLHRIPVRLRIEKVDGFSGHADVNELIKFVYNVKTRPERILLVHGQENKVENMINALRRYYTIGCYNRETYRA